MWIVRLALRRPYTFVVGALLVIIFGIVAILSTPADVFPEINSPVINVVWIYPGMSPRDMEQRIVAPSERFATTVVNAIEHIESNSLFGVGVIKIYFVPGGNDPPAHHPVQRDQRADPAARDREQDAVRAADQRLRVELSPGGAGDRAGVAMAGTLRGQSPADHGRPGPGRAGVQGDQPERRQSGHQRPEPHAAIRHGEVGGTG